MYTQSQCNNLEKQKIILKFDVYIVLFRIWKKKRQSSREWKWYFDGTLHTPYLERWWFDVELNFY